MPARVIQGRFIGGQIPAAAGMAVPRPMASAPAGVAAARCGPPAPAFGGGAAVLRKPGSGSTWARASGLSSVEVDPIRLGLARGGGSPLPQVLLAKLEGALGADFSAVRVHVGPQAARIGAVAFTTGNDIYFAPGRYQPESVQGQQLIGHELGHVVQQRQGRVRAPGNGVAIVHDRLLEAEADRMGERAASAIQRRTAAAPVRPAPTGRIVQRAAALAKPADSSGFSSTKLYTGQIYGIWKNEQYPNKILDSSLDPKKCLYVGKTNPELAEDMGARYVTHCRDDAGYPWHVDKCGEYNKKDDMVWPYVVRQLEALKDVTRFDIAAAEQYWLERWGHTYNKINALTLDKFDTYKGDKSIFTTAARFPAGWKPKNAI